MRRRVLAAGAAGAVALAGLGLRANPALAQSTEVDPRWQAWIGCWEQVGAPGPVAVPGTGLVCVIPAEGRSAVDIVAVANGAITTREHIDANGERRESVRNGCAGWELAEWSQDGRRLYLRAEHSCPGGGQRRASGLLGFSAGGGQWLDVQSVAVGAYPGVRVVRYREAVGAASVPDEVARAVASRSPDHWALRAAAGGVLHTADVIEASGHLDAIAVESWLVARDEGFDLNANRLRDLADQGVPDRVIDVMVALSYPGVFAVNAATRGGGARVQEVEQAPPQPGAAGYGTSGYYDDHLYSPFGWGPYAYGYNGYGYGGWYWGNRPIIIVTGTPAGGGGPGGGGSGRHGRVVNGRGYSGGDNTDPQARPSRPGSGSTGSGSVSSDGYAQPRSSGGGSSGGGGGSTSSGGGSSSGGERTAKPRP